ncbi:CP2 transcription factor [Cordyceps fumosorosea ARSEF 2679]|uniref:CP2 transcription factor n=1 Tax=Cordyceps fumosorosea (strain ARSEF 2679) TaxID=1081104 RepID=A0A168EBR3_CORFA|nr:CP2 transcription factor [Cordyceps fumosorosea ARSEF 2679]OAA73620.1 CP2 transcription factor [Cordyceps fumosorosea ARSEF 2679]
MFSQRTSAQKPDDELLANFRQQFPQIGATTEGGSPGISQTAGAPDLTTTAPPAPSIRPEFHDQDPTPRANNDPWRFTPSLLDPNSFAFTAFGHGNTGLFTPGIHGPPPLYQSQAGDLHTPTMAMLQGVTTPFGAPASLEAMQSGAVMDPSAFHPVPNQQINQQIPPFQPYLQVPGQHFAPANFVQHDTGYETMEQDPSPMGSEEPDHRLIGLKSQLAINAAAMNLPLPPSAEKFRFHSTLNAATAMVKQADEIPITYLNKGQAYSLLVADTQGAVPVRPGTRYRTFVRVSFEDEEQRSKPSVCWGLWKEGRGTNEAHQRGGKLQAVEYVEASQPAEGDEKRTRIEVESSSFDGFCVTWTPGTAGAPEVNIAVRFNFLSTDFSHSKGVKGIPVRLCAKTTQLSAGDGVDISSDIKPDVCYCKVKLFRDHGAERKLSNDVAHIKKSIEKLKQQIAQAESGVKDSKRKRQSIASKASVDSRSGKVQKHKRTWSMSSTSSNNGGRPSLEDDLHFRLQTLQDMFTSTRPISVLFLRGEDADDMDLHPVSMPGDTSPAPREGRNWQARSGRSSVRSSLVSPSPSSLSLASQSSTGGHWQNFDSRGPEQVTTVNRTDDSGTLSGWIEALGVDPTYRPPPERGPKPVACLYVQYDDKKTERREYHRAVYLYQRSLPELNKQLAAKFGLEESRIRRILHWLPSGLEVELDNDVVQELREGQDMRLEVEEIVDQQGKEFQMSVDGEENEDKQAQQLVGLILRLTF